MSSSNLVVITTIENANGSTVITLKVVDNDDSSVSVRDSFTVTVEAVDDPTIITADIIYEIDQAEYYTFTPTVTDVDSTSEFVIANSPSWASFDTSTVSCTVRQIMTLVCTLR